MAISDELTGTSVENRFWHIEEFHSSRYLVYDMGSNQVAPKVYSKVHESMHDGRISSEIPPWPK